MTDIPPYADAPLPIPNNDTRGLVDALTDGRPFGQETVLALEPVLARYCIQVTPPNALGQRTKIGDPISRRWVRLGFGEGHWVWVVQNDIYEPDCAGLAAKFPIAPPPAQSPGVTPPPPPNPGPSAAPAGGATLDTIHADLQTVIALLSRLGA